MTTEATIPISVLMLCYNRAHYMRQAIESVLNQTYRDFEFIILDHGSMTDEVYSIAKEYAEQDSRIRLYREETNHGISWGRNKVLEYAKGKYIATIEDDDYWALDKLEKQYAFMSTHPDIMVLSSSRTTVDKQNNIGKKVELPTAIFPASIDIHLVFAFEGFWGSGGVYDREKLIAIGGWRNFFQNADDIDLFHRLQEKYSYASTSESHIFYRIGENTSDHSNALTFDLAAKIITINRRRNLPDLYDVAEQLGLDEFILQHHFKTDYGDIKHKVKLTKYLIKYFLIERKYDFLARFLSDCYRHLNDVYLLPNRYRHLNAAFVFRIKIFCMSIKHKRFNYWWYAIKNK